MNCKSWPALVSQSGRTRVLKPGVYFARVDGEGVVIDLFANRYLALTAASAEMWQCFEDGLRVEDVAARLAERQIVKGSASLGIVHEQLEVWAQAGMLI